jgi:hypothetical protein
VHPFLPGNVLAFVSFFMLGIEPRASRMLNTDFELHPQTPWKFFFRASLLSNSTKCFVSAQEDLSLWCWWQQNKTGCHARKSLAEPVGRICLRNAFPSILETLE